MRLVFVTSPRRMAEVQPCEVSAVIKLGDDDRAHRERNRPSN